MNFSEFWNTYINQEPGIIEILLRLLCAMVVGTLIGLEREFTHRPAGLRTHILVTVGACVVSIIGQMLFIQYASLGATPDPARLSAQVITGVGFLGAGTIMKEGASVKGLTTAASVWAVACLGLAAGFGYYALALAGMILIFITLRFFESIQQQFLKKGSTETYYILDSSDISASLVRINAAAHDEHITVYDLEARQTTDGYQITFRGWFSGRHYKTHHKNFFDTLAAAPETQKLRRGSKDSVSV